MYEYAKFSHSYFYNILNQNETQEITQHHKSEKIVRENNIFILNYNVKKLFYST